MISKRFHSMDCLKGIFIFFAMFEHYTYYFNVWDQFYTTHPNENAIAMPMSWGLYFMGYTLIPWVSHSFLFIACFNIGRNFKSSGIPKTNMWPIYFLVATIEGLLISDDWRDILSDAFSLQPLQTWVIVFVMIALVARSFGVKGIVVFLAGYLVLLKPFLVPMGDHIDAYFASFPAIKYFEYNPRIEYFLGTACVAFLLGDYLSTVNRQRLVVAIAVGCGIIIPWAFVGSVSQMDWNNSLTYEYAFSRSVVDLMFIWGINIAVLCTALLLESYNLFPKSKILGWCGQSVLIIYLVHRLFFIHVYGPWREKMIHVLNWPKQNNVFEVFIPSVLSVLIAFLLLQIFKRYKVYRANSTA